MLKLSKPNWNLCDTVQLCSLKLEHNKLGQISAEVRQIEGKYFRFKSEIFNSTHNPIGSDEFSLVEMQAGSMSDLYMQSNEEYREKNFGIGKLLRLVSVMEMLKNQINQIKLYSVETAIYFHSKFGFEPDIRNASEREATLFSISKYPIFKDLQEKAQNYAKDIAYENVSRAEIRPKVNNLAKEFIGRILKKGGNEYKEFPFDWGMDMLLTDEKIWKMHEFYDQAYKDSGIDFRV